jgi:2'-5' RNA ligase
MPFIMRMFIAIPLPEEVKNNGLLLQEVLDRKIFRITRKEQIHVTIAFLGETDKKDVENIINRLEKIRFKDFNLKTRGFGFFPSENKILVVWIGLEENEDFMRLQHEIRGLFDFKEKMMPHITIARARELIVDKENRWKKKLSTISANKNENYEEIEFLVDKFILFESIPGPEDHMYKQLHSFENV